MALAISSGRPIRPSGVIVLNISLPASASSLGLNWPSMIGVSLLPGDSVFTRNARTFSLGRHACRPKSQVRLGSSVSLVELDPFQAHARGHKHDRAAITHQRN